MEQLGLGLASDTDHVTDHVTDEGTTCASAEEEELSCVEQTVSQNGAVASNCDGKDTERGGVEKELSVCSDDDLPRLWNRHYNSYYWYLYQVFCQEHEEEHREESEAVLFKAEGEVAKCKMEDSEEEWVMVEGLDVEGDVDEGVVGEIEGEESVPLKMEGGVADEIGVGVAGKMEGGMAGEMEGDVPCKMDGGVASEMEGDVASEMEGGVASEMKKDMAGEMEEGVAGEMEGGVAGEMEGGVAGEMEGGEVKGTKNMKCEGDIEVELVSVPMEECVGDRVEEVAGLCVTTEPSQVGGDEQIEVPSQQSDREEAR